MSTRSRIGILHTDETIDSIYCHFDGYLENNGVILQNDYQDINKVKHLINLGDISVLGKNLYPESAGSSNSGIGVDKECVIAYHRDGKEDLHKYHSNSIKEFEKNCIDSDQEYAYLYSEYDNKWWVSPIPFDKSESMTFKPLDAELSKHKIEYNKDSNYINLNDLINDEMQFEKDYDQYSYNDNYLCDEDAYNQIEKEFSTNDGIDRTIKAIKDIDSDDEYIQKESKDMIDKLGRYKKENFKDIDIGSDISWVRR